MRKWFHQNVPMMAVLLVAVLVHGCVSAAVFVYLQQQGHDNANPRSMTVGRVVGAAVLVLGMWARGDLAEYAKTCKRWLGIDK